MSDRRADSSDPAVVVRAALETLVFAPIGLGAKLVDDTPAVVRRVRQELSNARLVGRLTVEHGTARLRPRAEPIVGADLVASAGSSDGDATTLALPIENYDEMPAIEIVGRLEALTPAQRAVVADHENAHRRRRTVLGKIAQLAE